MEPLSSSVNDLPPMPPKMLNCPNLIDRHIENGNELLAEISGYNPRFPNPSHALASSASLQVWIPGDNAPDGKDWCFMIHPFMLRAAWPSFSSACLDFKVRVGKKHSNLPAGTDAAVAGAAFAVPAHQPTAVLAPAPELFPGSPHPAVVVACALEYIYTLDYTPTTRTLISGLATPGQQHQHQHATAIAPQASGLAAAAGGCPSNATTASRDPSNSINPNVPSATRTFYSRRHALQDAALLSSGHASTVYGTQRVGPEVNQDELLVLHLAVWMYGMRYGLERMAELALHKFVVAAVAGVVGVRGALGLGLGTGRCVGMWKAEGDPSPSACAIHSAAMENGNQRGRGGGDDRIASMSRPGKSVGGCGACVVHDKMPKGPLGGEATSNGVSSAKKNGRGAKKKSTLLQKVQLEISDFEDVENEDDSDYVDEGDDESEENDEHDAEEKYDSYEGGEEEEEQHEVEKKEQEDVDEAEHSKSKLKRDIGHCITLLYTYLPARTKIADANSNNNDNEAQIAAEQADDTRDHRTSGSSSTTTTTSTKKPKAIRLSNPLPDAAPARAAVLAVLRVLFLPQLSGLIPHDGHSTSSCHKNMADYRQRHDGDAQSIVTWQDDLSALAGHGCADKVMRDAAAAPPREGGEWEDEVMRLLLLRRLAPRTVAGGYDGATAGHDDDHVGGEGGGEGVEDGLMGAEGQEDLRREDVIAAPAMRNLPAAHATVPGEGGGGGGGGGGDMDRDLHMGSELAADIAAMFEGIEQFG